MMVYKKRLDMYVSFWFYFFSIWHFMFLLFYSNWIFDLFILCSICDMIINIIVLNLYFAHNIIYCSSLENLSVIVLQRLLCSELISRLALSLSFSVINLLILAGCSSSVSNINFVINKLLFYFNYYYFPLVNFISRNALIVLMQIQNSNFLLIHLFLNIYQYLNSLILYFL